MADPVPADWDKEEAARLFDFFCAEGLVPRPDCIQDEIESALATALRAARENALEEAAKVAAMSCLVPPDGGEPTHEERDTAARAASAIRSLKSPERKDGV